MKMFVWPFSHFRRCKFDRAPNVIITDQDEATSKVVGLIFPESRHGIAYVILRNMTSNIFRDIGQVYSTSIRFIKDGYEAIHPSSLRWGGRIYLRNLMLNRGAAYEQCTINVSGGLSVI